MREDVLNIGYLYWIYLFNKNNIELLKDIGNRRISKFFLCVNNVGWINK